MLRLQRHRAVKKRAGHWLERNSTRRGYILAVNSSICGRRIANANAQYDGWLPFGRMLFQITLEEKPATLILMVIAVFATGNS